MDIYWAFTSSTVRIRMKNNNEYADSLQETLSKKSSKTYCAVAIQSLHILAGIEYEVFVKDVKKYIKKFSIIAEIGYPLLWDKQDINQVVDALITAILKKRLREYAVIYKGHGTHYEQEKNYEILTQHIGSNDSLT